jgi:hypothetical protein
MVPAMLAHLTVVSIGLAVALFASVLLCLELGRRIGFRSFARDEDSPRTSTATVEAAIFGLMGLLLAFTFSSAMQRWEARRVLVVAETNAIGTAWLRIDSLAAAAQPRLRELFRSYTDARLDVYRKLPEVEEAREELVRSEGLQKEIWSYAVAQCLKPEGEKARLLLLPALNEMIDITTNRTMALITHPPVVIYLLLLSLVLASALMAGYAMSASPKTSWLHTLCFAAAVSIAVYVVLDLEFPRAGLIRISAVDQVLIDQRASMK